MKIFLKRNGFIIIFLIALMMILIAIYTRTFASYDVESLDFKYGKVKTSCLNIRCGPGVTFEKVGQIHKDDHISILGKIGDWYVIKTESNLVGAVFADYVEEIYDATETVSYEISTDIELSNEEQDFLNLINANRANYGLEELKIDKEIQNIARLKAADLENNDYFSHKSPIYGTIDRMLETFQISYIKSGENIAGNNNLPGAVEAWMNSENHKKNILNKDYNYTGIAVKESKKYGKIFVQVFVQKE